MAYVGHAQSMSARQVLDRSAKVYASCSSYLDEGQVKDLYIQKDNIQRDNIQRDNRQRTTIKPFSTAFVRPAQFRFEFKNRRGEEEWDSFIAWQNGEHIILRSALHVGDKNEPDLITPIARLTGISSGSALTIPRLLMPYLLNAGRSIMSLTELKPVAEESLDAVAAYRIEGKDFQGTPVTLWIDKERLLILKIYQKKRIRDFEVETTTTYKPQVNVHVPSDKLALDQPELSLWPARKTARVSYQARLRMSP
jgi:hypothetical protein